MKAFCYGNHIFILNTKEVSRMIKFYQYKNCTTCKKAAKFLDEYGVSYEPIDIVQHTPTINELKTIIADPGVGINKLFNTHGAKYRELDLK